MVSGVYEKFNGSVGYIICPRVESYTSLTTSQPNGDRGTATRCTRHSHLHLRIIMNNDAASNGHLRPPTEKGGTAFVQSPPPRTTRSGPFPPVRSTVDHCPSQCRHGPAVFQPRAPRRAMCAWHARCCSDKRMCGRGEGGRRGEGWDVSERTSHIVWKKGMMIGGR